MKILKITTLSAFLMFVSTSFAQTETIVGVAAGNENFTTLVTALKAADLVETLSSEGPFTVFAPVNSAFEALPAGTVESLLEAESKSALAGLLTYHVVAGKYMAGDVIKAIKANEGAFPVKTVQGGTIILSLNGDKVMLKDEKGTMATVVMADVATTNGVIHAVDTVVMPE